MNIGFSVFLTETFWVLFLGFASLVFAGIVLSYVRHILNTTLTVVSILLISLLLALAFAIFAPFVSEMITNAKSSPSDISLAVFSIITSVLVAYSLQAVSNFENRRDELSKQISDLTEISAKLQISETKQEEINHSNKLLSEFLQARTSCFLHLFNLLNNLNPDTSEQDRKKYFDLMLFQTALGRANLDEIEFDLREIEVIIERNPARVKNVVDDVVEDYLRKLTQYLRKVATSDKEKQRAQNIELSIRNILKII